MILTEDKKFSLYLERDPSKNITGMVETVELEFSNKELLHAILTCGMPMQRLTCEYMNKRKMELLYKMFLIETALEEDGRNLTKSQRVMYLDSSEKSVMSYYVGMFFTKLISKKMYDIDYLTHLNMIENIYGNGFIDYFGKQWRPDMIGYRMMDQSWSVWEAKGGSNRRAPALKKGCQQVADIAKINGKKPSLSAVCMTYYSHGFLSAVIKEPESTGGEALKIDGNRFYRTYYEPIRQLFVEAEDSLKKENGRVEVTLEIPYFGQDRETGERRSVSVGMSESLYDAVIRKEYGRIRERLLEENKDEQRDYVLAENSFMGADGIYIR